MDRSENITLCDAKWRVMMWFNRDLFIQYICFLLIILSKLFTVFNGTKMIHKWKSQQAGMATTEGQQMTESSDKSAHGVVNMEE